jgi:hypothetical protein
MSPLHGYRARFELDEVEEEVVDSAKQAWAHGPCLYLGPRGQRCDRAALEDGFCERHSPEAIALGPWIWFRRLAAILLTAAILWPIIEALLEELSHWRH